MAIIKSHTDIPQSRKLAEFLSLESVDMYYMYRHWEIGEDTIGAQSDAHIGFDLDFYYGADNSKTYHYIPCWSLAALLSVLPPYLFEFERGIDLNVYPNLNGKGWHCSYMPNCIENMKKDKFKLIISEDSLVDACYEMILKLHERKLL